MSPRSARQMIVLPALKPMICRGRNPLRRSIQWPLFAFTWRCPLEQTNEQSYGYSTERDIYIDFLSYLSQHHQPTAASRLVLPDMGATQSTNHSYVLDTPHGKLQGIEQRDESGKPICHRFLRVPYAQPPVGQLRWRRPQSLQSFTFNSPNGTPGDYTNFGPVCPQPYYATDKARPEPPSSAAAAIVNTISEDCLYLNIWVPAGKPPPSGWPVQFNIHGGWLQVGHANQGNETDPFDLLRHSTPRVIVAPTYRLNLFGFLAGSSIASQAEDPAPSNYGFWDQRAALEWTHKYISHFNGNPDNITVGGLSAGAHSTCWQLYYDVHLPPSQRIIKRIYLWSNAVAIQPPAASSESLTSQFNELCAVNNISTSLSASERLAALRSLSSEQLVASIPKMNQHTFRACTDNDFIPSNFLQQLQSGAFTSLLATRGISIFASEMREEWKLYKLVNPPHDYPSLVIQLQNYYPATIVKAVLESGLYNIPSSPPVPSTNTSNKDLADNFATLFAHIVADIQIHASVRNLTSLLLSPPPSPSSSSPTPTPLPRTNFHRAIISWNPVCMHPYLHPSMSLCHGSDAPIYWYSGYRCGWSSSDKAAVDTFLQSFGEFLYGKPFQGQSAVETVLSFSEDGSVEYISDPLWERGMDIARVVRGAQEGYLGEGAGEGGRGSKL
jgi:carboxylesterase type B